MKILLFILLALQAISTVIVFISFLPISIFTAIICLLLGILQAVLTLAVISDLSDIENIKADMSLVFSKLYKLEESINPVDVSYDTPSANEGITSEKSWKCIKCGTINKSGSSRCSNCNDSFSYLNPTYDPNPSKMSRFLKEKKKLFSKNTK